MWVSVYSHTRFRPTEVVQAFWKEERQGSGGTLKASLRHLLAAFQIASGKAKPEVATSSAVMVSTEVHVPRSLVISAHALTGTPLVAMTAVPGLQIQRSMPDYSFGAKQSPRRRHHWTAGCLRPPPVSLPLFFQSLPASDAEWLGFVQLTALCEFTWRTPSLAVERMTAIGSTHDASSLLAR